MGMEHCISWTHGVVSCLPSCFAVCLFHPPIDGDRVEVQEDAVRSPHLFLEDYSMVGWCCCWAPLGVQCKHVAICSFTAQTPMQ